MSHEENLDPILTPVISVNLLYENGKEETIYLPISEEFTEDVLGNAQALIQVASRLINSGCFDIENRAVLAGRAQRIFVYQDNLID